MTAKLHRHPGLTFDQGLPASDLLLNFVNAPGGFVGIVRGKRIEIDVSLLSIRPVDRPVLIEYPVLKQQINQGGFLDGFLRAQSIVISMELEVIRLVLHPSEVKLLVLTNAQFPAASGEQEDRQQQEPGVFEERVNGVCLC